MEMLLLLIVGVWIAALLLVAALCAAAHRGDAGVPHAALARAAATHERPAEKAPLPAAELAEPAIRIAA
jgi:hypothetical protein